MEKVQSTLLGQIRVVADEQPIVAWVSRYSCITLIVGKYQDSSYVPVITQIYRKRKN